MAGISIISIFIFLWTVFATLFWMYIAWRVMRAHDKLAKSVEDISAKQ